MTRHRAPRLTALLLLCLYPASVSVAEAQAPSTAEGQEPRTGFTPEFLLGAVGMPISIAATASGLLTLVGGEITQHPPCIAGCSSGGGDGRDATELFIAGAILLPIGVLGMLVTGILLATNPRHRPLPSAPTGFSLTDFSLRPTEGGALAQFALAF